jgi:5'-nucleotidase
MDFQVEGPREQHFQTAADFLSDVLKSGLHQELSTSELLNINVPDCTREELKGLAVTKTGFRYYSEEISERHDFKNRKYYWVGGVYSGFERTEGSDCLAIDRNQISLTPLNYLQMKTDNVDTWKDLVLSKLKDWS